MRNFLFSRSQPLAFASLFLASFSLLAASTLQVQVEFPLTFAVIGGAEPKPLPEFPNMANAVDQINRLATEKSFEFVAGIGDIPHKGTLIQYEGATEVFKNLSLPFYTIMGNEERDSTEERYLSYLAKWNEGKTNLIETRCALEFETVALVFASADTGRDFDDSGIDWMLAKLESLQDKPVLLFIHSAQAGAYPGKADKGVYHPRFSEVIVTKNLAAVISGDLHMDMDRVEHSKQISGVHYLHIPALERTKVPDETYHTPMFRAFTIGLDGHVMVDTYEVGNDDPLDDHSYEFFLPEL